MDSVGEAGVGHSEESAGSARATRRIVLAAAGSRGDVVPFEALAAGLRERGHEVVVVTHASLAHLLPSDIPVITAPSDPDALLAGPATRALTRLDPRALNDSRHEFAAFVQSFAAPTREAFTSLGEADVLIASTFAVAAVDAARTAGVPVIRAHQWPELDALGGPMPIVPYAWRLPGFARRALRTGLRSVEPYFGGVEGQWRDGRLDLSAEHPVGLTTATLGTLLAFSPRVDDVTRHAGDDTCVTGWWRERASGSMSSEVNELVSNGDRWVYVGFGSMPQRDALAAESAVRVACDVLDVRAVTTLPGVVDARSPQARDAAVVGIGQEPHDDLFAAMSAVVHHGGSGTTGTQLAAGVPGFVVPHVADQFYWGHRLHALGVAPAPLPRALLNGSRLAARLEVALRDDVATRARALGQQVGGEDGVGTAVRFVEERLNGRS